MSSEFSADELLRYSRHLSLPGIGLEGQRRLKAARVLVVGAGGLGSPVALYLAAAGVGRIGLVDFDVVDATNLQRQILHGTGDIGRRKVDSAKDRLYDLNPHVVVERHATRLTSANALEILGGYDVIVDGTDNFPTRYLTNDACVILGTPNVHGSIFRFEGQASVFATADGPCYRCLFPEPPPPGSAPSCAEGGVFGVLPGLLGVVQATETIKLIAGVGETLAGRLLLVDALRMQFRTITLRRDPRCPACGTREIRELIDYEAFCGAGAASSDSSGSEMDGGAEHAHGEEQEDAHADYTPADVVAKLERGESFDLIDVREEWEYDIARLPGARLVPLGGFERAIPTLDRSREIVVYCHHGMRSAMAASLLRRAGFTRVHNLDGGIDRWSDEVDGSVARY